MKFTWDQKDIKWGDCYYVTRGEKNNGIWCQANKKNFDGNIITVDSSAGTGVCFYQDKPFITNGKVHCLKLKKDYPPLNCLLWFVSCYHSKP